MSFKLGEITKDQRTGERSITLTISNSKIKIIKSAVEFYTGDKDDTDYQKKMEELRDNVHQAWRKLNPS